MAVGLSGYNRGKYMNWRNIYKGMAMGIVETVPGVSSSTIAMLLGIYENIIIAISNLTTKRYKKSLFFLLPIIIGILIGAALSAVTVKYLLETYPIPTHFLFMGLILGMLPFIWRSGRSLHGGNHTYKSYHFILMIFFLILIASLGFVDHSDETIVANLTVQNYVYLFLSGWLASIALVLPGMSGALMLMIVGAYYTALNVLFTINIMGILMIVAGIIIGILITGKLVRFMLQKYHQSTYAGIIGMLCGSVFYLYPGFPMQIPELIVSILLLLIGFCFAFIVSNKQNPQLS